MNELLDQLSLLKVNSSESGNIEAEDEVGQKKVKKKILYFSLCECLTVVFINELVQLEKCISQL